MDKLVVTLLYSYIFLSCLPSFAFTSEERTVLPFLGMVIVLLWWMYFCVDNYIRFADMDVYLGLFVLFIMASLWFNPAAPLDDWISLGTSMQLTSIFVVTRTMLTDRRRITFALSFLLVGLFLLAAFNILKEFNLISLELEIHEAKVAEAEITRAGSLAGGINRSSFYFGTAVILFCALLWEVKSFLVRMFLWIGIFVVSLANLLTYSVGGLISLAVGFLILLAPQISLKEISFKKAIWFVASLSVLTGLVIYNPRIQEKYEQIQEKEFIYWGSTRGATYLGALKAISEHPLLGGGPDQLTQKIGDYYPIYNKKYIKAAHNTFLSIAGEVGLIGFFFFIYFLLKLIVLSWRHRHQYWSYLSQSLFACLWMALTFALAFDLQRDKLFWIILGLNGAVLNISQKDFRTALRRF